MTKGRALLILGFIAPIEQIIERLNKRDYRDCDVAVLDKYYYQLIRDAAKILNISVPSAHVDELRESLPYFNAYVRELNIERFTILLNFFNSVEVVD